MKRSQIVLFAIFLVISGLIYIPIAMNKKSYKKDIKEEAKTIFVPINMVKNQSHVITLNAYGQISPVTELMVSFEIQGKLVKGKNRLKPGSHFNEGEVLYMIDGEEMFYTLAARKTAFAAMIASNLPDYLIDFPSESLKLKWIGFLNSVRSDRPLSEFPAMSSDKESLFWTARGIKTEYYSLLSMENRYEKYTYRAPFSGTVVEIYSEPGSIVNPGTQIAKIAKTGEFELKVPVSIDDLDSYKKSNSARFIVRNDKEDKEIANGKIIRISDVVNQRTQSVDVYYSVVPVNGNKVYNGMFLNATIDQQEEKNAVILPVTAVADGKVYTLEGTRLVAKDVFPIGEKSDSVYVTGLTNGTKVVLEQVGTPASGVTYKGIQR